MLTEKYISPEISLLDVEVERGFSLSQDSPGLDIGIGEWESENEDYDLI